MTFCRNSPAYFQRALPKKGAWVDDDDIARGRSYGGLCSAILLFPRAFTVGMADPQTADLLVWLHERNGRAS